LLLRPARKSFILSSTLAHKGFFPVAVTPTPNFIYKRRKN